jgi:tRNA A37 threonylcarbamoyladenosine biosynthesis protein TsaE
VDLEDNLESGIVIIEWPEMARQYGVVPTMEIFLSYAENSNQRRAQIEVLQQKKS